MKKYNNDVQDVVKIMLLFRFNFAPVFSEKETGSYHNSYEILTAIHLPVMKKVLDGW